ncbi:MAG: nitrate reductase subunit beta [Chloroflexi bacterium]|nr:nitrate reductase subunit beta [Chloroflexota bacterium]
MDIRAQVSAVFHLDKCIGCHTCSIACKNIWTSRDGAEYMWWNNVETKPGTGYPTMWEDQRKYRGGWELNGKSLTPRLGGRLRLVSSLFHNPNLPTLDDYYEPWTYQYGVLTDAPKGEDQPTARPVSRLTGRYIDIEAGPNWDDDMSGSAVYARNDVNLEGLTLAQRASLFQVEQMAFFYIPRNCNHCLNPACVAVCPSSAPYKRAEDGIVLVNQDKCRGWRFCISGCPYKKVYYNWKTGKSEKCVLCYPRLESRQAPACFHSCVGRIRYVGLLLYDAERIGEVARAPEAVLVEAQRSLILDPRNPAVASAALRNGISQSWVDAACESPIYKWVKEWELALPLHPEFRTLPTLFYVPPLLPVVAASRDSAGGIFDMSGSGRFSDTENARLPLWYLARLFSGGNEKTVERALDKLRAVRLYKHAASFGSGGKDNALAALKMAGSTPSEAEAISRLTALPRFQDRFSLPPYQREASIEATVDPMIHKGRTGFGPNNSPRRGP